MISSILFKERELIHAVMNVMGVHMTIVNNRIYIQQIVTRVEQMPMQIELYGSEVPYAG